MRHSLKSEPLSGAACLAKALQAANKHGVLVGKWLNAHANRQKKGEMAFIQ